MSSIIYIGRICNFVDETFYVSVRLLYVVVKYISRAINFTRDVSILSMVLICTQVAVTAQTQIIPLLLFPTPIPLSGVDTTCFKSRCDKDSAIIFTIGYLPDVNPSWE
jgi:hypothetical protein